MKIVRSDLLPKNKCEVKSQNKTHIICTDTNQKVKGVILSKNESEIVVDLPTGFQMKLSKRQKYYVFRVGLLEFITDGWEVH